METSVILYLSHGFGKDKKHYYAFWSLSDRDKQYKLFFSTNQITKMREFHKMRKW